MIVCLGREAEDYKSQIRNELSDQYGLEFISASLAHPSYILRNSDRLTKEHYIQAIQNTFSFYLNFKEKQKEWQ